MTTIIRVKRKVTDDPADCLIIECKKKKLIPESRVEANESVSNKENSNLIKQVFKYAGIAYNESEVSEKLIEISSRLKTIKSKKDPKANVSPSAKEASLQSAKKETKSQRYVLLNKKRRLGEAEKEAGEEETEAENKKSAGVNIIDVIASEYANVAENDGDGESEKEKVGEKIACNGVELVREKVAVKSNDYVYDIYFTKSMDIHLDLLYPNNYEIKSLNLRDELVLMDDAQADDAERFYHTDDEDSNDEANWRNDYPDEEECLDEADDDIENEQDEYYGANYRSRKATRDIHGDLDDEYGYGYDEEEDIKLSNYMKKTCLLDRSKLDDEEGDEAENSDNEVDDYDEYSIEMPKFNKRIF